MPIGTIVNAIAVLIGSAIGLVLHDRLPAQVKAIVFQGLGLSTIVIGVKMALNFESLIPLVFSVLIGGISGECIRLEERLEAAGAFCKSRVRSNNPRFSEGMITAFIIFCVGSMTIVGTIDEGLRGNPSLLYTKSILDGFASIALASTYGIGVLFSVVPLVIFQGGLTLLASQAQHLFTPSVINQLTAVGGVLLVGLAFNLLEIRKINVTNMLPALPAVVILTLLFP
ncbi:MAG: DUF554 domain-containing protein [Nitrospirota bacterium]